MVQNYNIMNLSGVAARSGAFVFDRESLQICDYCGKTSKIFIPAIKFEYKNISRKLCNECLVKANNVIIEALDKKFGKINVFANRL